MKQMTKEDLKDVVTTKTLGLEYPKILITFNIAKEYKLDDIECYYIEDDDLSNQKKMKSGKHDDTIYDNTTDYFTLYNVEQDFQYPDFEDNIDVIIGNEKNLQINFTSSIYSNLGIIKNYFEGNKFEYEQTNEKLKTVSAATLPENGKVYLLFTYKGTFLYVEENEDEINKFNFFDKNKYASYTYEISKIVINKNGEEDYKYNGNMISISDKIENLYNSSSLSKEDILYGQAGEISRYKSDMIVFDQEDRKVINIGEKPIKYKSNYKSLQKYLKSFVKLFKKDNDFYSDQYGYIADYTILNDSINERSFLLTVNNTYIRGLSINKIDYGDELHDLYNVNYKDASGIFYQMSFIYKKDNINVNENNKCKLLLYKDNDFFLSFSNNIFNLNSEILFKNERFIYLRDKYGVPIFPLLIQNNQSLIA